MTVDSWWDHSYPFRIPITLSTSLTLAAGHPVAIQLDVAKTVSLGKVQDDFQDLNVVFYNTTEATWLPLPRHITSNGTVLTITFDMVTNLTAPLADTYFVYYGNPTVTSDLDYTPNDWPVVIVQDGPGISYTRPGEHWNAGVSETLNAVATVPFYGSQVRIVSDLGRAYGIAEVRLDDESWSQVDLFSVAPQLSHQVYSRVGLSPNLHYLQIRCPLRANPSATTSAINVKEVDYKGIINVKKNPEETDSELFWTSIVLAGT